MLASMGKVTRLSISVALMPAVSVMTVTVGAVKSGKTSTGAFHAVFAPQADISKAKTITTARLRRDQEIRESIAFSESARE